MLIIVIIKGKEQTLGRSENKNERRKTEVYRLFFLDNKNIIMPGEIICRQSI
jgi:hypothetical protein